MVQKPVVLNWHRDEFAMGKKENIPAEALRILEEQAKGSPAPKKEKKPSSAEEKSE